MFKHKDTLEALNTNLPLSDKLRFVHDVLKTHYVFIDRIAIATYDPELDILKTFIDSSGADSPLRHYEAKLEDAPSLRGILKRRKPRVVNNLEIFASGWHPHTRRIASQGYTASYTIPMYIDGSFFGFIFFNSYQKSPFNEESLHYLDIFGHLITLVVNNELSHIQVLLATVKTARDITQHRDFETGSHLDRMSHYARLIAKKLAESGHYDFSDEFIERVFVFSPLHDIGKITIPDDVLLKPGKLDNGEFEVMKTHALKGREIIDQMLGNFHLHERADIDILRNIAEFHHEAINGSGYPHGLHKDDIPIEARIVAVADVFDALTSQRPYKPAWSNEQSFDMLQKLAGVKLDPDCVHALLNCRWEIEEIQDRFQENPYG